MKKAKHNKWSKWKELDKDNPHVCKTLKERYDIDMEMNYPFEPDENRDTIKCKKV